MPGVDGFDVLQWMQQRPTLNIPALVLTSSSLETDKSRTQSLGAKGYFVKPSNPFELTGIVRELDTQWLTRAGRKREKKMNL
jgi:CheY-like chemotaxis protein